MKRVFFLTVLFITIQALSHSQPKIKKDLQAHSLSKDIKAEIDKLFSTCNVSTPGYSIGIIKDEHVLYAKGYGSANLDYKIPITDLSSFDIASVSKQFTGAAIALLIMDNKLELNSVASDKGRFIE